MLLRSLRKFVLVSSTLVVMAACSTMNGSVGVSETLSQHPLDKFANWAAVDREDGVWLVYYDRQRQLWLREPDGGVRPVTVNKEQAPAGIAMAPMGDGVAMMWRDKYPDKGLFVLLPGRTEPLEIGAETDPLARISLHADGRGGLDAVWYGERPDRETGLVYHLFHRHIGADGTLGALTRVASGIYPVAARTHTGELAMFSWLGREQRIIARIRDADSGEFGAPVTISTEAAALTPIFQAYGTEHGLFVAWVRQLTPGEPDFQLEIARSLDGGATWSVHAFDALRGFDVAELSFAAGKNGAITLAASGRHMADAASQMKVYVLQSPDGGASWGAPTELRDAGFEYSRADNAKLIPEAGTDRLWLLWEDWRMIRPRVFGRISEDGGRTWSERDFELAGQPPGRTSLSFGRDVHFNRDGRTYVVLDLYADDRIVEKSLVAVALDAQAQGPSASRLPSDEAALRGRVNSYWQAMQQHDFRNTYALLDPFLREAWNFDIYRDRMGRIHYHAADIVSIERQGYMAQVTMRVRASVPEFKSQGRTFSVPEREVEFVERWLFVGDDWYREYEEEASEIRLTQYR
jgi:hypothetical protein